MVFNVWASLYLSNRDHNKNFYNKEILVLYQQIKKLESDLGKYILAKKI